MAVFEGQHLRHDLETGVTEWIRCVGCGNVLTSNDSKARGYGDRCADYYPDEVLVVRLRVAKRHDRERFRQWRKLQEMRVKPRRGRE